MIIGVEKAIELLPSVDALQLHKDACQLPYKWPSIAERTENVYNRLAKEEPVALLNRLKK